VAEVSRGEVELVDRVSPRLTRAARACTGLGHPELQDYVHDTRDERYVPDDPWRRPSQSPRACCTAEGLRVHWTRRPAGRPDRPGAAGGLHHQSATEEGRSCSWAAAPQPKWCTSARVLGRCLDALLSPSREHTTAPSRRQPPKAQDPAVW